VALIIVALAFDVDVGFVALSIASSAVEAWMVFVLPSEI
jgi:hypothetical protein